MSDQKYKRIDGEAVPVLPAVAKEIVKHKRTGKEYDRIKLSLMQMWLIPNTDTTAA